MPKYENKNDAVARREIRENAGLLFADLAQFTGRGQDSSVSRTEQTKDAKGNPIKTSVPPLLDRCYTGIKEHGAPFMLLLEEEMAPLISEMLQKAADKFGMPYQDVPNGQEFWYNGRRWIRGEARLSRLAEGQVPSHGPRNSKFIEEFDKDALVYVFTPQIQRELAQEEEQVPA